MTPAKFPESNSAFTAPADLDESQCETIPAFRGEIRGGNLDGLTQVIVAWLPSPEDLARLQQGGAVYLTCIGGLVPHRLSTTFEEASAS